MLPLLTPKEVADYLKVSRSTIYEWAAVGVIPSVKLGPRNGRGGKSKRPVRFRTEDIEEFIKNGMGADEPN